MSRSTLRAPFDAIEVEMARTFFEGCHQSYPQSHSDMQGGLRALLKRFDVQPRAIPLDWAELFPEDTP